MKNFEKQSNERFYSFGTRFKKAIVLIMCFMYLGIEQMSSQTPLPVTFTKGRLAFSHDGNMGDNDDVMALAMQWPVLSACGVANRLVHIDVGNNYGGNDPAQHKALLESLAGHTLFPGFTTAPIYFDDQTQKAAAIANFKAQAEAGSADDILYLLCAGPMEMPWQMINAVDPAKRKFIHCISHNDFNNNVLNSGCKHTWTDLMNSFGPDGTQFTFKSGFMTGLGTGNWSFMKTMPSGTCINPSAWSWVTTRDWGGDGGVGDVSDTKMTWYLLTGDPSPSVAKYQARFMNPICGVPLQFAITATAGANGSISPSGNITVNSGASKSFAITPNSGYQIDVLTIDGVSQPITNPYNFANVTANHSIAVTFKVAKVQYAITATAGSNGSISPSGSVLVDSLASQTYSITPNSCSVIEDVKVDGISQGAISSYTFTNVTAIHTISATFKSKQYTITASAGTNGSISPSGTILVNCGANTCFTVVPNSGYMIDTVFVDGISQGAATCINNITSNHTISATFKVADQPVSAITGWVSGTNNTKVVGSNRLMVVMVMGESKSSFGANGVTYGGQPMTKQTDKMYFVSGNRTYASIFTLNEAGVNAATSGAIAVTWSATPSVGNSIYSVLLSNVDQTTSVSTSLNNALTGTSIATATTLAAATGDMAIMCGATENNVIQTFNNGFIKQFETNSTWGDGVGGYKLGTGINETPKFTQSTSGRMAICALVVKKVSSFISPSRTSKNIQTTNAEVNGIRVYPNPVSDILYVDFAGVEASREIKVFDMEGQLLHRVKTSNSTVQIDVKSLKIKGIVMLQVIEGGTVSSHRVIIK